MWHVFSVHVVAKKKLGPATLFAQALPERVGQDYAFDKLLPQHAFADDP